MDHPSLTRRATLKGLAAGAALAAAPIRAAAPSLAAPSLAATSPAAALLDRLAWGLLAIEPGDATRLGVDTGAHAALRGRLADRSPAGVAANRHFLTEALTQLATVPRDGLDQSTLTSLAVTQTAFRTALDGMALPYGVATIGSWRNTPYGVIQNVGAWLDVPQILDGDQPVHDAADAEAYLARLAAMGAQLDGETARIRIARLQGLVPPAFLLDRTITGMTSTLADASRSDGPLIGPLARKTAADSRVTGPVPRNGSFAIPSFPRWSASWRKSGCSGPSPMMSPGSVRARTGPNGMHGGCAPARRPAAPRPICT